MAEKSVKPNFVFGDTTNGDNNVTPACRLSSKTFELLNSADSTGGEEARIEYIIKASDFPSYVPIADRPHPDKAEYLLDSVSASERDDKCYELTEIYLKPAGTTTTNPPDNIYSLRTSAQSKPIMLNPRFWDGGIVGGAEGGATNFNPAGLPDFAAGDRGKVADWAVGFVSPEIGDGAILIPEGMQDPNGKQAGAFPANHKYYGLSEFLDSGAEWTCVSYQASQPTEADLNDLNTIGTPQGLGGTPTANNWLKVSNSWEQEDGWWKITQTWRFNRGGWNRFVYADA